MDMAHATHAIHRCSFQTRARGGEPCDNPGVNSVVRRPLVRRFTSREDLPQERVYLTKRFTIGEKIHHRREDLPHERRFTTASTFTSGEIHHRRKDSPQEMIHHRREDFPQEGRSTQERRFTTGEKTYHGEKIHQERRFAFRTIHHGEESYLRRGD